MGVPRGGDDVTYRLPTQAELQLAGELFGELGYAPKNEELLDLIMSSNNSDTKFKRMWFMLACNTVIAPTTSNNVNIRWYAMMLLYIDAIDLTGLGIVLPDGAFAINVWTNELISEVLRKDIQTDNTSYGKLVLKPRFGMDLCLFGGFQGLDKFMRLHSAPNCSSQKFDEASAIVGHFSSRMMGLLGKLVHGLTSMDDEGSAEVSCHLETCLRGLSSAIRNTRRTPPSVRPRRENILGKQPVYESYTNDQSPGGGRGGCENDDSDSDDDTYYRIVYHTEAEPYDASCNGEDVDARNSATTNADVSAIRGAKDEGTPICVGDKPVLESQTMLTKPSRTTSVDEREGMLNQLDMIDTQVEVAPVSSLKRCSASIVKPLDMTYTRRKKWRLLSPPQPVAPVHPTLLSDSVAFQELGVHLPDKVVGETIPPPSREKQNSRRCIRQIGMAKASSNASGASRSHVSTPTDNKSCDMTSSQKKVKKAVRKVSISKSRTSTRFRAISSQLPLQGVVGIEGPSKATSSNEVAQDGVTGSSASSKAATTYECATDVPVVEVVHQLAARTTIATVVEDLVDVAVFTEAKALGSVTVPPILDATEAQVKIHATEGCVGELVEVQDVQVSTPTSIVSEDEASNIRKF
ncbi:hypothetical protein ZWY2020_000816 [Hordeum vulgare]|nr:hypothetical protein ZWY2020_000816 [Hordeum vulgare]